MEKGAKISKDGQYRYTLWRIWDNELPLVMFLMLNPSTADGKKDDPTIKKCMAYAKAWGCGGIWVGNLYAYRSSSPSVLNIVNDPIGPKCDLYLEKMAKKCDLIIAAWGNNNPSKGRVNQVRNIVGGNLDCLEISKSGQPKHPLYLKKNLRPIRF